MSTAVELQDSSKNEESVENTLHLKERAERNRQKALLLRKSKVVAHPYSKGENGDSTNKSRTIKVQGQRVIDSGGGFLIEENDDLEEQMLKITAHPAPIITDLPRCDDCKNEFNDSYLLQTFNLRVCDMCRDSQGKHSLITKTEAKQEYLLKDCDFDKREPPLKFITRKNPHNTNWGEMKLYLHLQVEERALEVWGSEEKLIKEKELRDLKREGTKIKKFNKRIKQLRMQVRSSLYNKTSKATHTHEFGEDTYNEEDDNYTHTCTTCGYEETYEKM
ncbi:DNA repair protein complementing XP-A cells homolog Xpac [Nomia melanderi]|uniref:DNA repair protein complementing XP-A cells homolog Xpac n=1 Tax=Nomia melanderi TaxID=2448451 RepID=UPI00130478B0|nr:DNA repair protein complementing XP-A cells homolog [Nomia melanderi]XP_031847128.1 DNA repair protein complementing XP-A cells homolog [Nomia melanderi]XP_031847129.1 DNA repair protein complementing XP-A cells homolog [Nomia melanderi]XP_031847130.1 DNA repair protein complementing XP-A cells homolog [Nomia melanderi]XP_031847131.1 DNA repair protein complementing XP-A cells homolog [Nomia melanderi]XP_031847132.1 DNA repair protein complementing XP-A cells homolog [Nomia melanderi]